MAFFLHMELPGSRGRTISSTQERLFLKNPWNRQSFIDKRGRLALDRGSAVQSQPGDQDRTQDLGTYGADLPGTDRAWRMDGWTTTNAVVHGGVSVKRQHDSRMKHEG